MESKRELNYFDKVKALHAGAANIATANTREELYDRVVDTIHELLQYPYVTIMVPRENRFEIVKTLYESNPEERFIPFDKPSLMNRVYSTGKSHTVEDVTKAPDYLRASKDWNLAPVLSVLLVPVKINEKIEAIIIVDSAKKFGFSELDIDIFEILSTHVSTAFSRIYSLEELMEVEKQNKAITDQAEDSIILIDFEDRIKFWNPASERLFGYYEKEAKGKTFYELLVPESQQKKYIRNINKLKQMDLNDSLPVMECICQKSDGEEIGVDVSHSFVMLEGVPHVLRMVRENSERKKYEERLQVLYTHIMKLSTARTEYEVAIMTREAISSVFGFNHGSIALRKGDYLEYLMQPEPENRFKLPLNGNGISLRAYKTGEMQLVQDVTQDPDYTVDYTVEYGEPTFSELDIPISVDNEVVGIVNVESNQKNRFSESDVKLIGIFSENVAITINRIWNEAKKQQYEQKLEALHGSAVKLKKANTKVELYLLIEGIIEEILGFHWIGIAEPVADGLQYKQVTGRLPNLVIPYDARSVTVRAYREKKTTLVPDVTKDPDYIVVSESEVQYQSELVVPIMINDEIISLINIESVQVITETDKKLMDIVGIHVASEIERIKNEETIREDEQRLRTIKENAVDAIFIINEERIVTLWNKSSERIFGYSTEEAIGKNLEDLIIPKGRLLEYRAEIGRMFEGHIDLTNRTLESVSCRSNGEEFTLGFTVSVVKMKGESHLIFIARDITLEKKVEEQLQELNAELARSNQDLENYTYVVSHDLKAPLRSIRSFSSFLLEDYEEKLEGDGKEYLDRIIAAVTRMDALISDLLIISRIGRKFTDVDEIDLNELLTNIQLDLSATIQARNAEINVSDLPVIEGQRIWVTQLFTNLISNGLKFNNKDKPTINIECKHNLGEYLFSVSDNGIGIPKEYHESIFKLFERLHTTEEYEGTGAGLTICKKIVENFGGKMWVESEEGEGSTFYFTYPIPL